MKRTILGIIALLFSVVFTLALVTACGGEETDGSEYGTYYHDAGGEEYLLELGKGSKYTLTIAGEEKSGNYTLDGELLTLQEKKGEGIQGSYRGTTVTLTYNGTAYTFYKKIEYTVTFNTNGGSAVESQKVINGKPAVEPKEPEKTGAAFIKWSADKEFKSRYDFATPVTGDLTLYAQFIALIEPEYTVTFETNGGNKIAEQETVGHAVHELPVPQKAGSEFEGWWVSHYYDANELTYRYEEGMALGEDTTLYAVWKSDSPAVSVDEKGVKWDSKGNQASYEVKITSPSGGVTNETVQTAEYAYDFTGKEAGRYTVEVTWNGHVGTAYYKNKGLARVSAFRVEGNKLLFNAVENATSYTVQVVCGTEGHVHGEEPAAAGQSYDFGNCDMPVKFVVKAHADGYVSSESKEFTYTRQLASPTLTIDEGKEEASWTEVENATYYEVKIAAGGSEETYAVPAGETHFALKEYASGAIKVTVTARGRGWNASDAATATFTKARLASPKNVRLENGNTFAWDAVSSADHYVVTVDGSAHETKETRLSLAGLYSASAAEVRVSVQAVGTSSANASLSSEELVLKKALTGADVSYKNGTVYWNYELGVEDYTVTVNGESAQTVDKNHADVTLTAKENTIAISYGADKSISLTVKAFKITFDAQEGDADVPPIYVADGNELDLPDAAKAGHTFLGWFTAANRNGRLYNENEAFFTDGGDLNLYAGWRAKQFKIHFNAGVYSDEQPDDFEIEYGSSNYTLPVLKSNDNKMAFAGWYTANSLTGGTQYTDFTGKNVIPYMVDNDLTLYAVWAQIYTFRQIEGGYAVSKNMEGIGYVSEITIPSEYAGEPVTTIEDFTNCTSLVTINIPDSITTIQLGTTGAAFAGCSKLANINVLPSDDPRAVYGSHDGVLYFYNQNANGRVELKYYPYARKDVSYTVPATVSFGGTMRDVSVIPEGAFYQSTSTGTVALETLHLPATISLIEGSAFYNFRSLKNVVFEEVGTPAATLDIRDNAFGTSSNNSAQLEEITLPQRLSNATRTSLGNMETLQRVKVVGTGDYTSVDDLLVKTEGRELVFYPRGRTDAVYTIPAGIDAIGEGAFSNAIRGDSNLTGIVIPSHVTKIGDDAFNGSYPYNFTSVVFEKGGQNPLTIGDRAFYGVNLTEIDLPNNLVAIGEHAFGDIGTSIAPVTVKVNTDLSTLNTPVESIDFAWGAFIDDSTDQRSYVETVEIGANVPTFDISSVFGLSLKTVTIDPTNPNFWKDSENNVIFDGKQEQILYFPRDLTEYTIPTQITRIADSLFADKNELTSVTIHSGVTSIGAQAFRKSGLTTINFEEGAGGDLTIGSLAFSETLVANIKLPARTKNLGARAFENCTQLETVELQEGITSIGAAVFYGCLNLKSVTIPASVEEISLAPENQYAYGAFTLFENCSSLTSVTVASGSKFYQMDSQGLLYRLRDAKTEQTGQVTQVPDELLWCVPYAEGEITVSPYIRKVYVGAFNMVEGITSVKFEDAKETWAADGTSQGKEITIEALTLVDKGIFYGCRSLETLVLPEGLKVIGARSISGYNDLLISPIKNITVPKSVTRIEGSAFYGMPVDTLTFVEGGTDPLVLGTDYAPNSYVIYPLMRASSYGDAITLKEVKFPARLKEIRYNAFYGIGSLEEVTFEQGEGAGLTIGEEAFLNCSSLSSIELPAKLTAIGDSAFSGTALTSVTLPAGLTSIGESAFADISALSCAIEIPAAVETIGNSAFAGTKIASLTFAAGSALTSIGDGAFENCASITGEVTIPATVQTIGSRAFAGARKIATVNFAENADGKAALRMIGDSAFAQMTIKSFTFPTTTATAGIITLGARLFEQCTQLVSVGISPSINSVDNVFSGCGTLQAIVVDPANKYFMASDQEHGVLYGKDEEGNKTDIVLIFGELDSVAIPDDQLRIAGGSFAGQTKITTVVIPRSITEIGANAFENCINLETVVINTNSALTKIGDAAFRSCFKLKSINLENATQLQNVGKSVFENCKALTGVTFGQHLTVLGDYMFRDSGLTSFTAGAQMVHLGLDTFRGSALESVDLTQATQIHGFAPTYSSGSGAVLTTSTVNRLFADCKELTTVKLPATFTQVSSCAFQNCTALKTVEGWNSLKLIGGEAFENSGLESFEIPATWTNDIQMGSSVFAGCTKLKKLTAAQNANLTELWDYFFYECPGLESIDLTNLTALVRLGKITKDWWGADQARNYTFEGCTSLTEVKLPASVTFLGTYTFSNCTSLREIDLSNLTGLAGIGATPSDAFTSTSPYSATFSGCESLETVTLPASCTKLAGNTFFGCPVSEMDISKITFFGNYCFAYSGIKSVKLSSAATYGTSVFDHCADLTEITMDADFVGNGLAMMFRGCTGLETVDLSNSKIKTLNGTFQDCTSLTSVTLPETLEEVRGYLFTGCSELQKMDLSKTKVDRFSSDKSTDIGSWSDSYIFQDCTSLTTVLVPEGFTQIGGSAFYNCTSLTKLAHSDADEEAIDLTDVIAVGKWAFMNAGIKKIIYSEKLETVIGYDPTYYGDVYQFPFMHAGTLETIEYKPTVAGAENENYKLIAGGAILASAEGDYVAMVKNVTATDGHLDMSATSTSDIKLASYAFYGVTLSKLTLPAGLTALPDYAFTGSKIDEVVLPEGLTAISNYAFQGSGIKKVDLKNVKTIGMYAFNRCKDLKSVDLTNAVELGNGAFQESGLTSVTIPAGLTSVGQWAFKDCDSLTTVTLNATIKGVVDQWGDESTPDTFTGCDLLETVTIAEDVTMIGANMFQNTPALTEIALPEGLQQIGANAFAGSGLTSVTVPAACTSIGQRAFVGSKLQTATIKGDLEDLYTVSSWDQSVSYIDWYTFAECSDLTKVVLEGNLPKIGAYMFYKTPALKTVATSASAADNTFALPEGIEEIGNYAFKESGITSVTLGASVQKIGTSAFEACASLTSVTLTEGLTSIGARAFADDKNVSNITVPRTVESLPVNAYVANYTQDVYTENNAFAGWTATQTISFQTTRYATVALLGSDWQIGLAAQISYAEA